MARIDSAVDRIASKILEKEEKRKQLSDILRRIKGKVPIREVKGGEALFDETLCLPMKTGEPQGTVVGVDGGLLTQSCHNIDLVVMRAVAVLFDYKKGKLERHEYFPESSPTPELVSILEAETPLEFQGMAGIHRASKEVETALAAAQKWKPDIVLLDGSVAPYPNKKPEADEAGIGIYRKMINNYIKLYEFCHKNKIMLAGVVEDSRGRRFSEILTKKILPGLKIDCPDVGKLRDSALLFDALDYGERTFTFKYSSKPLDNPVLKDLGPWAPRLYSFYAKTAEFDRPIRVDFIAGEAVGEFSEKLAKSVFSLGKHNKDYGIPTVIIEADARAKLKGKDIEMVYDSIVDKVGASPLALRLRRDSRPF